MVKFIYYDLAFLVLFTLGVALFLYKNRKNLQVESKFILLYRSKMGLDTIDYIGKKHPKLLTFLSNFVIIAGYLMMIIAVAFFFGAVILTLLTPALPKVPPLIPLLPYVDKLLPTGLLPPFYFTYWIIVIAVIAVCHEFAHGVFAKLRDIKIKSTGFGFVGPLLAAFVELDDKQMAKKPIKSQLAVLAAGSSANLLLWIIFLIISSIFFSASFVPNGVYFSSYYAAPVNFSDMTLIDNATIEGGLKNFDEFASLVERINKSEIEIRANKKTYIADAKTVSEQKALIDRLKINASAAVLYQDTPAYRANLSGAIQEISFQDKNVKSVFRITTRESLQGALETFDPGQEINIKTTKGNYTVVLDRNPEDRTKPFLGIAFSSPQQRLLGKLATFFSYKDPFVNYTPKGNTTNGNILVFIYHLLYWLTIINFFVMLFNMLPVGFVDGGRFFYLTALAITGKEKRAEKWFMVATWIILLAFLLIMGTWLIKAF